MKINVKRMLWIIYLKDNIYHRNTNLTINTNPKKLFDKEIIKTALWTRKFGETQPDCQYLRYQIYLNVVKKTLLLQIYSIASILHKKSIT